MEHRARVNGETKLCTSYTATLAIRLKCRECYSGYKGRDVPDCGIEPAPDSYPFSEQGICELKRWWLDRGSKYRAIRKYCLDCEGRCVDGVKNCIDPECPLYPYRFGTNPARAGHGRTKKLADSATEPRSPQLELGFPSAAV
jgi:hypothetical protein